MTEFFNKYPWSKDVAKLLLQVLLIVAAGYGIVAPIKTEQKEQTQRIEAQNEQIQQQNQIMKANAEYWGVPVSTVGGK